MKPTQTSDQNVSGIHIKPVYLDAWSKVPNLNVSVIPHQENIIREFNLNELYQKSKKLSKTKGDKVGLSQFPPVLEEEEPEQPGDEGQAEESESKKDK